MDEKILFVDDDSNILAAHRRQFHKKYKVIVVDSGNKGIDVLKEQGPIAVVVSDYRMPEMDGSELLKSIKSINPLIEVILMTAFGSVNTAVDAMREGAYTFITKPIDLKSLLRSEEHTSELQSH